jgi:hypothetical protein
MLHILRKVLATRVNIILFGMYGIRARDRGVPRYGRGFLLLQMKVNYSRSRM